MSIDLFFFTNEFSCPNAAFLALFHGSDIVSLMRSRV